jgi:phosphate starvation-inducible PhoH-like protein
MARKIPAKRATRPNPRADRNYHAPHSPDPQTRYRHKITIFPKSISQEIYLDALEDSRKEIVIATGPAGTGKSYLATMYAIRSLLEGQYQKIIITRPTVSTGEDIGFLPGNLYDKLAPWSTPILDIFKEVFPLSMVEKMIKDEIVEIAPLGMMRGRTLKRAFIIIDEAQNVTPVQMKMCLTRIGENSRMIVTGDLKQYDRGDYSDNGLYDFITRLKKKGNNNSIAVCEFGNNDIERHPIIEEVLRLYDEN